MNEQLTCDFCRNPLEPGQQTTIESRFGELQKYHDFCKEIWPLKTRADLHNEFMKRIGDAGWHRKEPGTLEYDLYAAMASGRL